MNTRYCRHQSNTIDSSICAAGPCPSPASLTWSPHPASTAANDVYWQQPRFSGCSAGRLLSPAAPPPAVVPHERPAACSQCWCGTLNGGEGRVQTFETERPTMWLDGGASWCIRAPCGHAEHKNFPNTVHILIPPEPCSHATGLPEFGIRVSIQPHQVLQTPSSGRRVAAPQWKRELRGPEGRGKLASSPTAISLASVIYAHSITATSFTASTIGAQASPPRFRRLCAVTEPPDMMRAPFTSTSK